MGQEIGNVQGLGSSNLLFFWGIPHPQWGQANPILDQKAMGSDVHFLRLRTL